MTAEIQKTFQTEKLLVREKITSESLDTKVMK